MDQNYGEIKKLLDNAQNLEEFKRSFDKYYESKQVYREPILDPINSQFTVFPIKYPTFWESYKTQQANYWRAEEIDFSRDYEDFMKLNEGEQHFIEMVLAFFAASDGIVNFNLGERFLKDIQINEAQICYRFQMAMEDIHSHTYSRMLDEIVKHDPKKKYKLFNAIKTIPAVKQMADWALKWIDSSESFAHRVIAFATVEGVLFSGAFAAIFWLKDTKNNGGASNGKQFMFGLVHSNNLISRDEGEHTKFGCEIYNQLKYKLPQNDVHNIITDGVEIAKNFMIDSIPVRLLGMNNESMCQYIEYCGDRLIEMLGYKPFYNSKNPFPFMNTIGLDVKTNFFEQRAGEYQDPHVMNKAEKIKENIRNLIDDDNF